MSNATHTDPGFAAALARRNARLAGREVDEQPAAPTRALTGSPDDSTVVAELMRTKNARLAAEQAERDRLAEQQGAAERARADALPVDDPAVDTDDEVSQLEQRIAAGDTTVTEAALTKARAAAAGKVRFARLRGVFDARQARRNAELAEAERLAAAEQHARDVLAPHAPAALVPLYDDAVRALSAYTAALDARNATVNRLVRLPREQRAPGAIWDQADERNNRLDLDGHLFVTENIGQHVERVLGRARIGLARHGGLRYVAATENMAMRDQDPKAVAEGRAQLDGQPDTVA